MKIPDSDIIFLKENPAEAKWLEENVEPRLWQRIASDDRFAQVGNPEGVNAGDEEQERTGEE